MSKLIVAEFRFTPEPHIDPTNRKVYRYVDRPYVRIRLEYGKNISATPVTCLIDSGCDFNLFPAHWGETLGIAIEDGEPVNYMGIGNSGLKAYTHKVKIHIEGTAINFVTAIDFSKDQQTPLLGRSGFFGYFKKITFEEENNKFVLAFK